MAVKLLSLRGDAPAAADAADDVLGDLSCRFVDASVRWCICDAPPSMARKINEPEMRVMRKPNQEM